MPQRRNAIKELRKDRKRRLNNLDIKTEVKKTIKSFLAAIKSQNLDEAKGKLQAVYKKIDKAVKRNVIHQNTANRRKSHYSRLLTKISS